MNSGDLISILILLAVGIYFAVYYSRSLQRQFRGRPLPKAFVLLHKVVPPVGWLIIALTFVYALTLLLFE